MLLEVKNLYFSYTSEKPLFQNLNLRIDRGEIVALAGESGCGKSTLLSIIYGLKTWKQGEIIFDGKKLLGPEGNIVPGENMMKLVAQDYDLMPYSTVYDNVGKFLSNIDLQAKRMQVLELLKVVGLVDYADVFPKNLSGGQQQRVAIARALSVKPKLLLLDEPFSNLDFSRKFNLRDRLFKYIKDNNIALIISTHNLPEVLPWLDRIIILQDGRLIQNDAAEDTYNLPYNGYVARLFGEVNILGESERQTLQLEKNFWYPHEIAPTAEGLPANLIESRFAGSHYWNKASVNDVEFIFYSESQLANPLKVSFSKK